MCKVLEVNSSNYYSFQKRKASKIEDPDHDDIIGWIQDISKFSGYTYGERRIKAALDALSFPMSRYKVAKLMKEAGVWVRSKKKYKVTINSDHKQPIFGHNKGDYTLPLLFTFILGKLLVGVLAHV
jgi:hypothetical protein